MCGICGQFNFVNGEPVLSATLRTMTATIAHRGPDDEGFYISGPLGLGFRRLSIIDLAGGHQPMSDADQHVWVAFNGEIYNFKELRAELEAYGHVFKTRSDTEVIVHGYKRWGKAVLERLNGMFGVAIWDDRARRLILARDAMGIKLLYYRVSGGTVTFGSELRPVLAAMHDRPVVDPAAINLFLRYRYTPSPLTPYKGVRKLAAGTLAIFEGGTWCVERWYRTRPEAFSPPKTDAEAAEELLAIYKRAVRRQLVSDVPVGLLLSGGLDSGLLLGLIQLFGDHWPTYTVGYGKAAYRDDELTDAAETAGLLGAANAQVQLTREAFERELPRIVSVLEEPVAASSIVPMYFVCQRARQDVKVALVGQGPDELFGGYKRHLGVTYGHYWRRIPKWLRMGVEGGIQRLPRSEALKRGVHSLSESGRVARYQGVFSLMPGATVDGLFQEGWSVSGAGDSVRAIWGELEPEMEHLDELGGFQLLELRSSLPDELLMYADKLSMAHGLEVRVPYLDREIVEYVERLPASFKVRLGQRKWLHRRVAQGFLPATILRRKKRGFAVDAVDAWFHGAVDSRMGEYLLDPQSLMYRFLLNHAAVGRLLEAHRSKREDNHKMLFSLVLLEQWLRAADCAATGRVTGP
ncbi:asparagine synthase (glutamine-hydrolyzing) [Thioalkalicoccus limnaeus]|uniref:asparagine synthase (glutamine-hydrolyzing) n=1 Tax=Thioalkalicoccus limnaeus TaxID=120681 RepID=A0ABV4BHL4_9GAMM